MYIDQAAPQLSTEERMVVVFPIGSCEQHGPHLPVDTDLRIARLLAERLTQSLANAKTLLLPALPFSCSWEHHGLGTLALGVGTMASVLHDIAQSLKHWNVPLLLILVNWHGGNDVLASLAAEITARDMIPTAVIPTTHQVGKAWDESGITDAKDIHAGAVETSIIQAYWPEAVKMPITGDAHFEPDITSAKAQAVLQAIGSYKITTSGIWGAPEHADVEKGRKLIDTLQEKMHTQVTGLLKLVNQRDKREDIK